MKRGLILALALACGSRVVDEQLPDAVCGGGDLRCEGNVLQLCSDTGDDWLPLEVCEAACDPERGCLAPACAGGESRCLGHLFQRCAADGASWEDVSACQNAALCEPEQGCRTPAESGL